MFYCKIWKRMKYIFMELKMPNKIHKINKRFIYMRHSWRETMSEISIEYIALFDYTDRS